MNESELEPIVVKVIRVKPINNQSYSVLASYDGKERGFTFGYDENLHEEENDEPKFVQVIREYFAEERVMSKDVQEIEKKLLNCAGKEYGRKTVKKNKDD